jgi:hypothetical protein
VGKRTPTGNNASFKIPFLVPKSGLVTIFRSVCVSNLLFAHLLFIGVIRLMNSALFFFFLSCFLALGLLPHAHASKHFDERAKKTAEKVKGMDYDTYVKWQLKKSLNPEKRKRWKNEEWASKLSKFKDRFLILKERKYFSNESNVLLVGARTGQEVVAMREIGVPHSIGMDLVEDLPFVVASDMHNMSFADNSFDFIFSNVYDHSLYPRKFASELHRVLKTDGRVCLHCMLRNEGDSFTVTRTNTPQDLIDNMNGLKHIASEEISMLGLNYEICFMKQNA